MLVLPLIPITALVIKSMFLMLNMLNMMFILNNVKYVADVDHIDQVIQNGVNMNTLQGYQTRVSTIRRQVEISFSSSNFSNFSTNAPGGLNIFRLFYFRQVRGAMEIALFIQNIQEERAEVALYIFINQV